MTISLNFTEYLSVYRVNLVSLVNIMFPLRHWFDLGREGWLVDFSEWIFVLGSWVSTLNHSALAHITAGGSTQFSSSRRLNPVNLAQLTGMAALAGNLLRHILDLIQVLVELNSTGFLTQVGVWERVFWLWGVDFYIWTCYDFLYLSFLYLSFLYLSFLLPIPGFILASSVLKT